MKKTRDNFVGVSEPKLLTSTSGGHHPSEKSFGELLGESFFHFAGFPTDRARVGMLSTRKQVRHPTAGLQEGDSPDRIVRSFLHR